MKNSLELVQKLFNENKKDSGYHIVVSNSFSPDDFTDSSSEQFVSIVRGYTTNTPPIDPEIFYFFAMEEGGLVRLNNTENMSHFWEKRSVVEVGKPEFDELMQSCLGTLKHKPQFDQSEHPKRFYKITSEEPLEQDLIMETEDGTKKGFVLIHWHSTA
ncbi:MAG: hypothetical protein AAB919_00850 [Patescibacteria group bacterium]